MSGVSNEQQLTMIPNGHGVWNRQQIRPADFVESSSNISVAVPYTGLLTRALLFNASAGTSDIAYTSLELPLTFKKQMQSSKAKVYLTLFTGNVSQNAGATNDNLEIQMRFVFKPGPSAADQAEIAVDYVGTPVGLNNATNVQDPPTTYVKEITVDVLKGLTATQRGYIVPGTKIEVLIRPNETVGTNVAMVVLGGEWRWLEHLKYAPSSSDITTLD